MTDLNRLFEEALKRAFERFANHGAELGQTVAGLEADVRAMNAKLDDVAKRAVGFAQAKAEIASLLSSLETILRADSPASEQTVTTPPMSKPAVPGTAISKIRDGILITGAKGISKKELCSWLHAHHPEVRQTSISSFVSKLAARGEIVSRQLRWYGREFVGSPATDPGAMNGAEATSTGL